MAGRKTIPARIATLSSCIPQTEALDLALRKKDESKALGLLDSTKSALDTVLAKLG